MANRKFTAKISTDSLEKLKQELLQYKNVELPNKCRELVTRLANEGITVASANVGGFGKYITFSMKAIPEKDGCKAIMIASENGKIISSWKTKDGIKTEEVSPLLLAEFGSGWGAENPMKIPGVGQGTFPNQTHAFDKEGWYWIDLEGNLNHSYGINAKMPMYKASLHIIDSIKSVAQEVFS